MVAVTGPRSVHVSTGLREFRALGKYPHMSAADVPVWEAFLRSYPGFFEWVEYDVRVGPGRGAPAGCSEGVERMARAISQLRIDAVGHRRGEAWLVEVKPALTPGAVGQLLVYCDHYCRDRGLMGGVRLCVVCGEDSADVGVVCDRLGIARMVAGGG